MDMNERRIEKERKKVKIKLSDGSTLKADIFFLSETLSKILNAKETFLPVQAGKDVLLLNRAQIISVSTKEAWEADSTTSLGVHYRTRMKLWTGRVLEGSLFVNNNEGFLRVKDFLLQAPAFFPLYQQGKIVYLHQKFILSVQDEGPVTE